MVLEVRILIAFGLSRRSKETFIGTEKVLFLDFPVDYMDCYLVTIH